MRASTSDDVQVTGMLDLAGRVSLLSLTGSYREGASGSAEPFATGSVATAMLGRFSPPGSSLLVPKTMTLAIRISVSHRSTADEVRLSS
jgi:hypothetical protein